jgi:hypothetical protein
VTTFALWGELLGILAFGPGSSVSPSNTFGFEDTPHLASPNDDPPLSGGGEGVQRPMSFPLLINGLQLTASTADQPPRRIGADQRDDQGALGFRDASLAAGARSIAKPIESLLVEAMDALAYRLGVAP